MNSRRGLLQIPQGVKPELFKDENFGIIGLSSADDVYVHAAPPAKDYQPNPKHRTQAIAKDGKFPAYLVDENAEPVSLVNEKLKKGQEVLARKIPGLKGIYEVVVFKPVENKITGMPETGDGIELVTKGFVREDQLQKSTHFPFIKPKKEQFKESSKDIFPNENLIDDVKQHSFGDCFLLSSILSILNQDDGPDFIKNMMVQSEENGEQYTTVRLYNPGSIPPTPVYIKVKNSLYYKNGKKEVNHKALWVHIIEKAYAAFAIQEKNKEYTYAHPSFRAIYGNGGNPRVALTILTGIPASEKIFKTLQYPWQMRDDLMTCLPMSFSLEAAFRKLDNQEIQQFEDLLKKTDRDVLFNFIKSFNGTIPKDKQTEFLTKNPKSKTVIDFINQLLSQTILNLTEIQDFIEKYNFYADTPLKSIFPSLKVTFEFGNYLKQLTMTGVVDEFFDLNDQVDKDNKNEEINIKLTLYFQALTKFNKLHNLTISQSVINAMKEYCFNLPQIFPLGSKVYSKEMKEIFAHISASLEDPLSCLTASTKASFKDDVPGLRPSHGYAIEEAYEDLDGRKFLRIRNPWGRVGRKYHPWDKHDVISARGEDVAYEDKKDPVSEVELSDFARYFSAYSNGKFTSPKIRSEANVTQKTFIQRHWKKILVCSLVFAAFVIVGCFTFGVVPAIVTSVTAAVGLTGVAATSLGMGVVAVGSAAFGALGGIGLGAAADKCFPEPEELNEYASLSSGTEDTQTFSSESEKSDDENDEEENDEVEYDNHAKKDKQTVIDGSEEPEIRPKSKSISVPFASSAIQIPARSHSVNFKEKADSLPKLQPQLNTKDIEVTTHPTSVLPLSKKNMFSSRNILKHRKKFEPKFSSIIEQRKVEEKEDKQQNKNIKNS